MTTDVRCKTCGGSGLVTIDDPSEGRISVTCPACNGFGHA